MTERAISIGREATLVRNRELLVVTTDFQQKYTAAVDRLGLEYVHRRDPSEPRDVVCMDEGLEPESPVTVRVAGPAPILERTGRILKQRAEEGIIFRKVFDHEYCGAFELNMQAIGADMDLNLEKVRARLATNFARDLTQVSPGGHTVEYGGKLSLTRRPKEKHTGQVLYYDARTAGLDPAHLEELDPGYVVSRGVFGKHAAREYAGLALNIAFGSHGLDNQLAPNTPMHLVGIVDSQHDEGKVVDGLRWIRSSRGLDAERIKIHVITA